MYAVVPLPKRPCRVLGRRPGITTRVVHGEPSLVEINSMGRQKAIPKPGNADRSPGPHQSDARPRQFSSPRRNNGMARLLGKIYSSISSSHSTWYLRGNGRASTNLVAPWSPHKHALSSILVRFNENSALEMKRRRENINANLTKKTRLRSQAVRLRRGITTTHVPMDIIAITVRRL